MLPLRVVVRMFSLAALFMTGAVSSQDFPNKPIRIVAAEPGGGNDFLSRVIQPGLISGLGQQVIIDNRPSRLTGGIVADAPPDGYTVLVAGSTFAFTPLLEKATYDPITSFSPVSQLERSPNVLVVNPSLPVKSVKELIAFAKSKPGELNYGSGTSGGSLHLAAEMFKMMTGVNMVRIPFKSTGPALIGLLGNQVQVVFSTAGGASAHIKSGKLRALAVTSGQPTALIPGVPTVASAGLPGFDLETMGFMLAPAKTPAAVVNRLNREVVRVMSQADVKEKLLNGGSEAVSSTPAELGAKLKSEVARMDKLFKELGLGTK
jgi:tripartite-type tricarboxylate transporter receptor subunit TctC